jgi:hypothetical protein
MKTPLLFDVSPRFGRTVQTRRRGVPEHCFYEYRIVVEAAADQERAQ